MEQNRKFRYITTVIILVFMTFGLSFIGSGLLIGYNLLYHTGIALIILSVFLNIIIVNKNKIKSILFRNPF